MNKRVLHRVKSKENSILGRAGTVLLLGLLWIFVGCGEEAPKPTKVPIPPVGQKPAAPTPTKKASLPTMEVKSTEPPSTVAYKYNAQGKPDPFHPLVVEKPEIPGSRKKVELTSKAEETGAGTPLERMELTGLKLVAIVWDIPNPRAMVEDLAGKGYILTLGTRIGKNRGQVAKITSTGVVVSEKYENSGGKIKTREVPLRLYSE